MNKQFKEKTGLQGKAQKIDLMLLYTKNTDSVNQQPAYIDNLPAWMGRQIVFLKLDTFYT